MIGILNSKAMDDNGVMVARIDEKPYKVLSYVLPFLEKIETGTQVEVNITQDDRISKINRVRQDRDPATQSAMKRAGFGEPPVQPTGEILKQGKEYNAKEQGVKPAEDCTSPKVTPAQPDLKTVGGQIVFLDTPAHKISVKDREGATHTFVWPPALHEDFAKLKQWWFVSVTGEHQKDGDLWKATGSGFFKRPDDWPFAKGGSSGGRPFQPRNEGLIVFQTCYKECCETVRQEMAFSQEPFDEEMFNRIMDIAVARAIKDGKALIAAGGA